METQVIELGYALDTFYFLIAGAFVMWMAAGFTMLEAGLVRSKSTVEILTKNIALFSIACVMYMVVGYNIMYSDGISSLIPGLSFFIGGDNSAADVVASGGDIYYSNMADFFFQVVFVATAMSIVSGVVAERMKLWAFLAFTVVLTGLIYPIQGYWSWGGGILSDLATPTTPARASSTSPVRSPRWRVCCCWVRVRASSVRTARSTPCRVRTCRWRP